jgi:hypothetical protein
MTPLHRAWTDGVIQGLKWCTWWRGGVAYVGDSRALECDTVSLKDAMARAESVWANESDDGCVEQQCRLCGETVQAIPDGLPLCDACRPAEWGTP